MATSAKSSLEGHIITFWVCATLIVGFFTLPAVKWYNSHHNYELVCDVSSAELYDGGLPAFSASSPPSITLTSLNCPDIAISGIPDGYESLYQLSETIQPGKRYRIIIGDLQLSWPSDITLGMTAYPVSE